jgi:natural product precursor
MKKINLKGISEILSEKELKNVMGGSMWCFECSNGAKGTIDDVSNNPYVLFDEFCPAGGFLYGC